MKRSRLARAATGALIAVALFFATDSADAAGEQFYMMFNCHPDTYAANTNWGLNQYGYFNTSTTDFLFLTCQQPHLYGNDGHNGGSAITWDRHPTSSVAIELCRNDGSGNEACETKYSTDGGPNTMTFAASSDTTRSYYYWTVIVPPFYGGYSSHINSLYFKDN